MEPENIIPSEVTQIQTNGPNSDSYVDLSAKSLVVSLTWNTCRIKREKNWKRTIIVGKRRKILRKAG